MKDVLENSNLHLTNSNSCPRVRNEIETGLRGGMIECIELNKPNAMKIAPR